LGAHQVAGVLARAAISNPSRVRFVLEDLAKDPLRAASVH
jgi:hypothetical protein